MSQQLQYQEKKEKPKKQKLKRYYNSEQELRQRLICLCGHHMWEHCFFKEPTKRTSCVGWVKKEARTCMCDSFVPAKHVIVDGKTNGPESAH